MGIALILGVSFGILAGYYPDVQSPTPIIWITDILMAFPTIILGAFVGIEVRTRHFFTIVAIAIAFIPRFIRLARGNTLSVKEDIYIVAAKSIGMSDWRIIDIHLLPNIISPVIDMAVIWTSAAITIEVALSFLGLGVETSYLKLGDRSSRQPANIRHAAGSCCLAVPCSGLDCPSFEFDRRQISGCSGSEYVIMRMNDRNIICIH